MEVLRWSSCIVVVDQLGFTVKLSVHSSKVYQAREAAPKRVLALKTVRIANISHHTARRPFLPTPKSQCLLHRPDCSCATE